MTFEQFKDKIFALAKVHGVEAQLSFSQNKNFQVRYQMVRWTNTQTLVSSKLHYSF